MLTAIAGRRNAELVQKQIDKLEAQLGVPTLPDSAANGLVEIVEELDESGNVVCTSWELIARSLDLTVPASKVSNVDESADQVEKVFGALSQSGASDPSKEKRKDAAGSSSSSTDCAENSNKTKNHPRDLPKNNSPTNETQSRSSDTQPARNGEKFLRKDPAPDLADGENHLAPDAISCSLSRGESME